jgi:hypothetical protein
LDSARHPLPGGSYLPTIAGHRDGCATDCPGTFLYALLPNVIDSVADRIGDCLPFTGIDESVEKYFNIYPNPAADKVWIEYPESGIIRILSIDHHTHREYTFQAGRKPLNISEISAGVYIVELQTPDKILRRKLIISP